MEPTWDANFFTHFSPMLCDGRIVCAKDGLLMFTRLTDGKSVGFHKDQVDMEALEKHICNTNRAGGSTSLQITLDGQTSLDLPKLSLKQGENFLSGTGMVGQEPLQTQQNSLIQPQPSVLPQTHHSVPQAGSVSSSIVPTGSGQGAQQSEFEQMELSLHNLTGVKTFMSELSLDRHHLQQQQQQQQQNNERQQQQQQQQQQHELSPSCDRELQSLADLVSSTMQQQQQQEEHESAMQVDYVAQTPLEQQQRQLHHSKPLDDVSISLSSIEQQDFDPQHMDKMTACLLPQTQAQIPKSDSSVPKSDGSLHNFPHEHFHFPQLLSHQQQSTRHQTLAPIQTLLSSLRQKNSRKSQQHQEQNLSHQVQALFPVPHPDMTPDLSRKLDVQGPGQLQKQTEDGEIEAFLKSVSFDLGSDQDVMELEDGNAHQMEMLHLPGKQLQQGQKRQTQPQQQQKTQHQHLQQQRQQLPISSHLQLQLSQAATRTGHQDIITGQGSQSLNFPTSMPKSVSAVQPETSTLARSLNNDRPRSAGLPHTNFGNISSSSAKVFFQPGTLPTTSSSQSKPPSSRGGSSMSFSRTCASFMDVNSPPVFASSSDNFTGATTLYTGSGRELSSHHAGNSSSSSTFSSIPVPTLVSSELCTEQTGVKLTTVMGNTSLTFAVAPFTSITTTTTTVTSTATTSGKSNRRGTGATSPMPDPSTGDKIWQNGKSPQARLLDKKATQALIQLMTRPLIQAKLASMHIKKKDVWNEIDQEMKKLGYVFCNPGEKCLQKWRSIEQSFKDYELSKDIPSLKHKKQPDFYCELRALLRDKNDFKSFLDEERHKDKLLEDHLKIVASDHDMNERESQKTPSGTLLTAVSTDPTSAVSNESAARGPKTIATSTFVSVFSTRENPSLQLSSVPMTSTIQNNISTSSSHPKTFLTLPELPSSLPPSSSSSSATTVPPSEAKEGASTTASLEEEVRRLQGVVASQSRELAKMNGVLASIQSLLREQRRDSEAIRAESGRRFSQLKALIGQNQRDKMKFMYDFLRAIGGRGQQHQPKRLKSQQSTLGDKGGT